MSIIKCLYFCNPFVSRYIYLCKHEWTNMKRKIFFSFNENFLRIATIYLYLITKEYNESIIDKTFETPLTINKLKL